MRRIIRNHQQVYDIGLHGPDLLFYYHPATANVINQMGDRYHDQTGHAFFLPAAQHALRCADTEAAVAYLYGVICHYALDSVCHPYVETYVQAGRAGHVEMETSFDRMLLLKDHQDPLHYPLCRHILPTRESAALIARFYPVAKPQHIYRSMRGMIFYNRLSSMPHKAMRRVTTAAMKLSGRYEELRGMLMPDRQNPRTEEIDGHLYALYQKAVDHAQGLLRQMDRHLSGCGRLGQEFDHTFGAI
jgi:hypothetical protein